MRRRDLEPRRHGDAVRRDSARRGLDVDDDQRPRDHPLVLLHRGRREAGRLEREASRHDPERHPEGVHGAARVGLSHRARAAPHRRLLRVGRDARSAVEYDLDLGLPHSRGRIHRGAGAGVHARRRLHATSSAESRAGSTSTTSRRACRSSGTSTTISSKRSRSCAQHAASGRVT